MQIRICDRCETRIEPRQWGGISLVVDAKIKLEGELCPSCCSALVEFLGFLQPTETAVAPTEDNRSHENVSATREILGTPDAMFPPNEPESETDNYHQPIGELVIHSRLPERHPGRRGHYQFKGYTDAVRSLFAADPSPRTIDEIRDALPHLDRKGIARMVYALKRDGKLRYEDNKFSPAEAA